MTIVTEIGWEQIADPDFGTSPTRQAFRQPLSDVVERAKAALPDSHSRIDKAVQLVLAGAVTALPDGTARVTSQRGCNSLIPGCQCKSCMVKAKLPEP